MSKRNDARMMRKARAEGRYMIKECRRILKKKRQQIPQSALSEVNGAIAAVERTSAGIEVEPLRNALTELDEQVGKHLAFARKSAIREYTESIGVAIAVALFLRAFVVEAFQIPSGSMIPTLLVGDHIFVSKFSYGIHIPFTNKRLIAFEGPKRGDVVVFKKPDEQEIDYIKRVVGLPGDKLELRNDQVFINGQPMPREFQDVDCDDSNKHREPQGTRRCELWLEYFDDVPHNTIVKPRAWHPPSDYGPVIVPDGEIFAMGDNRDNSEDSRAGLGTVPIELIKGRALVVWWSLAPNSGGWFDSIRWNRFFEPVK